MCAALNVPSGNMKNVCVALVGGWMDDIGIVIDWFLNSYKSLEAVQGVTMKNATSICVAIGKALRNEEDDSESFAR